MDDSAIRDLFLIRQRAILKPTAWLLFNSLPVAQRMLDEFEAAKFEECRHPSAGS